MSAIPLFPPLFTAQTFSSPLAPRSVTALPTASPNVINMTPPKPLFRLQTAPSNSSADHGHRRPEPRTRSFRQSLNTRASPRPSLNPLSRNQSQSQTRDAFLDKVRQRRHDQQWSTRSEQILQMDYLAQWRAWEAEQARAAPSFDPDEQDLGMDDENYTTSQTQDHGVSSQQPWYASPLSQQGRTATSASDSGQQMQHSQMSQVAYTGCEHDQSSLTRIEQDEVDAYLEAEAREMEALIALHEADGTAAPVGGPAWEELPEARREQAIAGEGNEDVDPAAQSFSSPIWGSDDPEFEEELWKLGGDAMDTSGA